MTSAVFSPRLERAVALAVVKYDQLQTGTEVKVFAGDEELGAARVAELPLVRGGWYEAGGEEAAERAAGDAGTGAETGA